MWLEYINGKVIFDSTPTSHWSPNWSRRLIRLARGMFSADGRDGVYQRGIRSLGSTPFCSRCQHDVSLERCVLGERGIFVFFFSERPK